MDTPNQASPGPARRPATPKEMNDLRAQLGRPVCPTQCRAKTEQWISVADRLPADLIAVIGWAPTFNRPVETYWCAGDWWLGESAGLEVTHWQPLPAAPLVPPVEGKEGQDAVSR